MAHHSATGSRERAADRLLEHRLLDVVLKAVHGSLDALRHRGFGRCEVGFGVLTTSEHVPVLAIQQLLDAVKGNALLLLGHRGVDVILDDLPDAPDCVAERLGGAPELHLLLRSKVLHRCDAWRHELHVCAFA